MPPAPSATYCRCCSFRIAPRGTLPAYVVTCRCLTPVPYEIVVDQGKPPAIRPRGPRKAKVAKVSEVEAPVAVFKVKLSLKEQIANLLRIEMNKGNLSVDSAAQKIGIHANILRRILKGNSWPTEETLMAVCNWLKYDVKLIGRD